MSLGLVARRLRWLRNWELFNGVFFLALLVWWIQSAAPSTWVLTAFSVGLVCYILFQGSLYWHIKEQAIAQRTARMPEYVCRLFTVFRRSSVALLVGFPMIALVLWAMHLTPVRELAWPSAFAGFAALEYVNYYRVQLMHDTANDLRYLQQYCRLRPAPLASDLRGCASGNGSYAGAHQVRT
ncbi:MAG: hypothetical protein GVY12_04365 [Bacteroidetes bacterium]|jgi:hypothetical protein|nr:hypothetical protein [Bacteroidota bacterium]